MCERSEVVRKSLKLEWKMPDELPEDIKEFDEQVPVAFSKLIRSGKDARDLYLRVECLARFLLDGCATEPVVSMRKLLDSWEEYESKGDRDHWHVIADLADEVCDAIRTYASVSMANVLLKSIGHAALDRVGVTYKSRFASNDGGPLVNGERVNWGLLAPQR